MTTANNDISFKEKQLRFERVRAAYTEKEELFMSFLKQQKLI